MDYGKAMNYEVMASGLQFPEGPVALADGSVLVVEIRSGDLTRVSADGTVTRVAHLGGGPNGVAVGPDGAVYIANNGGFSWTDFPDATMAPAGTPSHYAGGSIQRVDLASGAVKTVYAACGDRPLRGPNDLVFDRSGGFYFTDLGKWDTDRSDWGRLFYAMPDGSEIRCLREGLVTPNGVGLSPDESTLYVAESLTARLWAFDVVGPGVLAAAPDAWTPGRLVWGARVHQILDSLAVEADGKVCVASVIRSGIETVDPAEGISTRIELPGRMTTNLCFGGRDMRAAFVTVGDTGELLKLDWPRTGLALAFGSANLPQCAEGGSR